MRTLRLVGLIRNRKVVKLTPRLARFCAWGNHWMSEADEALHNTGAPTTHGMCPKCAAKFEAEFNEPKPAA